MFRAGGGLDAVKAEEAEDKRLVSARNLATICGKPPRLCVHALAMFQDNVDNALMWLFDHGTAYLPGLSIGEPEEYTDVGFGLADLGELSCYSACDCG